jgi:hypothetical protein
VGIGIQKINAGIGICHLSPVPGPKSAGLRSFIPVPDFFRYR